MAASTDATTLLPCIPRSAHAPNPTPPSRRRHAIASQLFRILACNEKEAVRLCTRVGSDFAHLDSRGEGHRGGRGGRRRHVDGSFGYSNGMERRGQHPPRTPLTSIASNVVQSARHVPLCAQGHVPFSPLFSPKGGGRVGRAGRTNPRRRADPGGNPPPAESTYSIFRPRASSRRIETRI